MFFIPGIIISIITFPGVIVHELAHFLFCRLSKVAVIDVKYFQFDMNTAGYVIHESPVNFNQSFIISVGPFLVNTLLCLLICFPASLPYYYFNDLNFVSGFLIWLGVSIGMHAFPSNQDMKIILEQSKSDLPGSKILKAISYPITGIFYIANILRVIWFDAIYGAAIGIFLPGLIFKMI